MLQESKQAQKRASQLATRANETQRELSRQEHVAEKLRGHLEEAHQVSQVPLGRFCPPEPGRGFAHSPKHRDHPSFWALLYGECPGDVSGIPLPLPSSPRVNGVPDVGVCLCWKVGTEVSEMAKSLQEAQGSLISDIETLNNLLSSLGETRAGVGCGSQGRARLLGPEALLLTGHLG